MRLIFPIAVAVLETGAALVFLYLREWRLFVLWTGYSVAAYALAWLK